MGARPCPDSPGESALVEVSDTEDVDPYETAAAQAQDADDEEMEYMVTRLLEVLGRPEDSIQHVVDAAVAQETPLRTTTGLTTLTLGP